MKLNKNTVCRKEGPSLSAVYSDRRGGISFCSKLCFQPFFLPSDSHCLIRKTSVFQMKHLFCCQQL